MHALVVTVGHTAARQQAFHAAYRHRTRAFGDAACKGWARIRGRGVHVLAWGVGMGVGMGMGKRATSLSRQSVSDTRT